MIRKTDNPTLTEFYHARFEPERLANAPLATRKHYFQSIARIDRYLGRGSTFDDIGDETMGGLMEWLRDRKAAQSTLAETRRALHALYWAYACDVAPSEPERPPCPTSAETMLCDYVGVYAGKRTLRPGSVYQYQVAANCFDLWYGRRVAVNELTFELVALWIKHLIQSSMAPATANNRRRHLLTLWRHAHLDGFNDVAPLGLPTVPVPWVPPQAWTYEEVKLLLDAAERLKGHYPAFPAQSQRIIRRATLWGLLIRLAWDTGLRTGDILALRPQSIRADGVIELIQSKTQRHHLTRIHPETQNAIAASFPPQTDTIIPWYATGEYARREFKAIIASAGIPPGSFKKLRKSSGSEIEMRYPGCGGAHLGHAARSDIARMHYLDPRMIIANKPMPRPLRELPGKGARP